MAVSLPSRSPALSSRRSRIPLPLTTTTTTTTTTSSSSSHGAAAAAASTSSGSSHGHHHHHHHHHHAPAKTSTTALPSQDRDRRHLDNNRISSPTYKSSTATATSNPTTKTVTTTTATATATATVNKTGTTTTTTTTKGGDELGPCVGERAVEVAGETFMVRETFLRAPPLSAMTLAEIQSEKHELKVELKRVDRDFLTRMGRKASKAEKEGLRPWYVRYWRLKHVLGRVDGGGASGMSGADDE